MSSFIIQHQMCDDNQLFTSYSNGKRSDNVFLDDYAFYTAALIKLYNSTLDRDYLRKAKQFCDEVVKNFSDSEISGFYLSKSDNTELFMNAKENYDGAVPSGNSVMAYNFVRLYQLTEKDEYRNLAEKNLHFYQLRRVIIRQDIVCF